MEASAIPHSHARPLGRLALGGPLLRLRSDEQLVALFRAGSEDAFAVMHDRYKQRLFAYCRQMLNGPRQDAEDVLQDVFVRAYGALRADDRPVNLRAWLYRIAHNRCIDQHRRPKFPEQEVFDVSRTPLHDPIIEAQRREDLQRLVQDVSRLPEQQRSALLMREIDGMSYQDLAEALGVTVPAVKSLLVRARVGLAEAMEARDTDCSVIREDLAAAYDKGVRASGRARRHLRECKGCSEYKIALRGVQKGFAALAPAAGFAPLALAAKALGLGGGGSAGGIGGGAAAGLAGSAAATKVATVVTCAALATGGAVEVRKLTDGGIGASRFSGSPAEKASGAGDARSAKVAKATTAPAPAIAAGAENITVSDDAAATTPAGSLDQEVRERRAAAATATKKSPAVEDGRAGSGETSTKDDPERVVASGASTQAPASTGDGTAEPTAPASTSASSSTSSGATSPATGSGSSTGGPVRGGNAGGSSTSSPAGSGSSSTTGSGNSSTGTSGSSTGSTGDTTAPPGDGPAPQAPPGSAPPPAGG